MLGVVYAGCQSIARYAECRYAEGRGTHFSAAGADVLNTLWL